MMFPPQVTFRNAAPLFDHAARIYSWTKREHEAIVMELGTDPLHLFFPIFNSFQNSVTALLVISFKSQYALRGSVLSLPSSCFKRRFPGIQSPAGKVRNRLPAVGC